MNKNKHRLSLEQKKSVSGLLFILPWLIGFIAFYVRSLLMAVEFSFSTLTVDINGYVLTPAGWSNYVYAFAEHGYFKQTLTSSVMDMMIDVPLIIFFSLFMAIMLNKKFKGRTLVRAIFFLPVILNAEAILDAIDTASKVVATGISSASAAVEEQANTGGMSVAYYMELFGSLMLPRSFLEYISGAVGRLTGIISASGVQIVIFIAALQSIPTSLYEAATMEGATAYETFWKITLPMVLPHIITCIVYTVVDSFIDSPVVTVAYNTAFNEFNYGLSSVFSLVSMLVTCAILALVCAIISKRTFYYN